jgi:hypothetical protein
VLVPGWEPLLYWNDVKMTVLMSDGCEQHFKTIRALC